MGCSDTPSVPADAAGAAVETVDGDSGGFNLHWAWASGIAAGEAAARLATERVSECDDSTRGSA